ncbi:nucleotidyltransferase substrate binding protein [Tissierella sp. Yu-01]|uniref:nucleotidyltransferase substrate binding protein n=1 Tax=Tissierella sp. Yu-01 TaxID=3035694 RepID=UPI00240DA574|nr:nucleotidyltransferase substrate binding protein [Tissierella sp. Yu-01]WFA08547.1 nucleotidyltransferase substrate binding protein [Tissierella sp. Yu-01]
MSGYQTKFDNFMSAIEQLKSGILLFSNENDLLRDGLIQRFEFTFELAWKTLKVCFEDEGLIGINSPKAVLKEAFSAGLIDNDNLWLEILNDRNSTSHIYNESLAIEICNKIINKYSDEFEKLASQIKRRYFE